MNWIELNKSKALVTMVVIVNDYDYLENVKKKANELINESPLLNLSLIGIWDDEEIDNYAKAKNKALKYVSTEYVSFVRDSDFVADYYEKDWLKLLSSCEKMSDFESNPVENYSFERIIMLTASRLSGLVVQVESIKTLGGFNEYLQSAEEYELLTRLKEYAPFLSKYAFVAKFSNFESKPIFKEDFMTYAYCLIRFKDYLTKHKLWNQALIRKANWAITFEQEKEFENILFGILGDEKYFKKIMSKYDPILIVNDYEYVCIDVLESFTREFYEACKASGRAAIVVNGHNRDLIYKARQMHISAVLGIQSGIFSDVDPNKLNINSLDCPKFINIFDHPLYISYLLMFVVDRFYCLACDGDYAKFAKSNFNSVKDSFIWYPGGKRAKSLKGVAKDIDIDENREYDLSFLGSFTDYRSLMSSFYKLPKGERIIANVMLRILRKDSSLSYDKAYKRAIDELFREDEYTHEIYNERKQRLVTMHHLWPVARLVSAYYREKVIRKLLDDGLTIHVFGNSWKSPVLKDYKKLIIHEELNYNEALEVYAKSKISLNIFAWHKDGLSERIFNAMFNNSLCVTDSSKALKENFKDKEELIVYELDKLEELSETIRYYLSNKEERIRITNNAYENVKVNHSWKKRVQEFEDILENVD